MTTVSRWFVMPSASGVMPAAAIASRAATFDAFENLHRVVLDPARARKILRDLAIASAGDSAIRRDHEAGRSGGPFIDRENVLHFVDSLSQNWNGGRCTPRSLTIALMRSAGVTSHAGF